MKFIDELLEHTKIRLEHAQEQMPLHELEKLAVPVKERGFKEAISRGNKINLIAELKKASPSQGLLSHNYSPSAIAKIYENNKAAAISVLTEDRYFKGSLNDLKAARGVVNLPVLRKDFIISEYQIYESAVANTDAILLIASILDKGILRGLYNEAKSLEMDIMVEVHNERDLEKALGTGAEIIGVNNRDLATFEVDINTTFELLPKIPDGKIIVSESGINDAEDVKRLAERGVKAVLIGTAFMQADDIASEMKRIMGW